MKPFITAWLILSCTKALSGEFQNLDFEEARTNNVQGGFDAFLGVYHGFGPTSELLPGWTLQGPVWSGYSNEPSLGPIEWIGFNNENLGSDNVSIFDRNGFGKGWPWFVDAVPQGNYALYLRPCCVPYILRQSGTVPREAPLLKFYARDGQLDIAVNGQPVVAEPQPGSPTVGRPSEWRADLSPWAGQEVALELASRPYPGIPPYMIIDNFRFEPVPEADVGALVAVGCVALWWWRRRIADPAQHPLQQGRPARKVCI